MDLEADPAQLASDLKSRWYEDLDEVAWFKVDDLQSLGHWREGKVVDERRDEGRPAQGRPVLRGPCLQPVPARGLVRSMLDSKPWNVPPSMVALNRRFIGTVHRGDLEEAVYRKIVEAGDFGPWRADIEPE